MGQTVVLLAEDEATIRSLVTISLQGEDFSVLPAGNADEARQVARSYEKIDLLLTDVQMCGGSTNGIELAERILLEKPGTKMLVISGYPDKESLAAEKGLGVLTEAIHARKAGRPSARSAFEGSCAIRNEENEFEEDDRMIATPFFTDARTVAEGSDANGPNALHRPRVRGSGACR